MTQTPTVLITGSSRGIGAACARVFAGHGYGVAINYRSNEQAAAAVADEVKNCGVPALTLQADVSLEQDVLRLFAEVDRELGPLSVLVNNAGILLPQMRVEGMTAERVNRLLSVNVTSCFLCSREAVKRLSTRRGGSGGSIVNVSSVAARLGAPGEYVDYAASKGAIDTLTLGLATEVAGEGIRVNCVRPGIIDTQIHADGGEPGRVQRLASAIPLQRGGSAEEVARTIYFLASPDSSYTTGAIVDVTGGR